MDAYSSDLNGLRKTYRLRTQNLFYWGEGHSASSPWGGGDQALPKPSRPRHSTGGLSGPTRGAHALRTECAAECGHGCRPSEYIDRLGLKMVDATNAPAVVTRWPTRGHLPLSLTSVAYCLIELTGKIGAQGGLDGGGFEEASRAAALEAEEIIDAVIGAIRAQRKTRYGH